MIAESCTRVAPCASAQRRFAKPAPRPAIISVRRGGIAQLGERLHGMQEVSGSIPLTSTTDLPLRVASVSTRRDAVTRSPSSRGLGHHPFTVVRGFESPWGRQ